MVLSCAGIFSEVTVMWMTIGTIRSEVHAYETIGVADSAASLSAVHGEQRRPSICRTGEEKIEKVMQNDAF